MPLVLSYKTIKIFKNILWYSPHTPICKSYHKNTSSGYLNLGKPDMWESKNAIQNSFWKIGVHIIHMCIPKYSTNKNIYSEGQQHKLWPHLNIIPSLSSLLFLHLIIYTIGRASPYSQVRKHFVRLRSEPHWQWMEKQLTNLLSITAGPLCSQSLDVHEAIKSLKTM